MTGPEHFRAAEQLLEHAAAMLDTDVAPGDRGELVQRQAAIASMATGALAAHGRRGDRAERPSGAARYAGLEGRGRHAPYGSWPLAHRRLIVHRLMPKGYAYWRSALNYAVAGPAALGFGPGRTCARMAVATSSIHVGMVIPFSMHSAGWPSASPGNTRPGSFQD
jgi:hypothetical protein